MENSDLTTTAIDFGSGENHYCGNLILNGIYCGRLFVDGTLTLGREAVVTGEIYADKMVMSGRMKGIAKIKSKAVFYKSAHFSGTIITDEAEMYSGSVISGSRKIGKILEFSDEPVPMAKSNNPVETERKPKRQSLLIDSFEFGTQPGSNTFYW